MSPRIPRAVTGAALAFCVALASGGCAAGGSPTSPSAAGDPDVLAAATSACIAQVNQLRASVGDPPLARSDRIVQFSTEAAHVDGEAHQVHKYFTETNGGNGVAMAENMIPWWKVSQWGSVDAIVRKGIDQMWAEGATGYHYINMRGRYSEMGCGIAVINGEVTVSQDFR
jgi:hypothetical protein